MLLTRPVTSAALSGEHAWCDGAAPTTSNTCMYFAWRLPWCWTAACPPLVEDHLQCYCGGQLSVTHGLLPKPALGIGSNQHAPALML